jgi:hypothetical protein
MQKRKSSGSAVKEGTAKRHQQHRPASEVCIRCEPPPAIAAVAPPAHWLTDARLRPQGWTWVHAAGRAPGTGAGPAPDGQSTPHRLRSAHTGLDPQSAVFVGGGLLQVLEGALSVAG